MICEECYNDLTLDVKHREYYCGRCGLIHESVFDFREDLGRNVDYGNYLKLWWPDEDLRTYQIVKPQKGLYFVGEDRLTAFERGSPQIRLDKRVTIHYCHINHESFISKTIWWINPENSRDRRWFCLVCAKRGGKALLHNWGRSDLRTARELGLRGLISVIQRDLASTRTDLSMYHAEPVRDRGYLRTAVLTALRELKKGNKYKIRQKGGKKCGFGAKSVKKFCDLNFDKRISFSVYEIQKILDDLKIDRHQSIKILTSVLVRDDGLSALPPAAQADTCAANS